MLRDAAFTLSNAALIVNGKVGPRGLGCLLRRTPGFAGVRNELYFMENCSMIFGDGKKVVTELIAELKSD